MEETPFSNIIRVDVDVCPQKGNFADGNTSVWNTTNTTTT